MLPDIPKTKKKLSEIQLEFMRWARNQQLGVFSDTPQSEMWEGCQHGIQRSNGETETDKFWEVNGECQFQPHKDNLETTFANLYKMAGDMANVIQEKSLEYLSGVCGKNNQVVNMKDKSPGNAFLDMIEKMEFPLNEEGTIDFSGYRFTQPQYIQMARDEIAADEELSKRFDATMKLKEENAHAKQANRKLVR